MIRLGRIRGVWTGYRSALTKRSRGPRQILQAGQTQKDGKASNDLELFQTLGGTKSSREVICVKNIDKIAGKAD